MFFMNVRFWHKQAIQLSEYRSGFLFPLERAD